MNYAIIVAAGSGERLKNDLIAYNNSNLNDNLPKQFIMYKNRPLWWHSAKAFSNSHLISGIIILFPENLMDFAKKQVNAYSSDIFIPIVVAHGGKTRQESVQNGLEKLPQNCHVVAVHDAARPFITSAFITKSIEFFTNNHKELNIEGLIPCLEITDTVKLVDNQIVSTTISREKLKTVQTPQIFLTKSLKDAHQKVIENKEDITDDASAFESINKKILCVQGEETNIKITKINDLQVLEKNIMKESISALGYDVHAYCEATSKNARIFKLGTVPIPTKIHIKAHSDGDVLLHALMDALLSLIGAGDIGRHFPDNDSQYDNISSAILLDKVLNLLRQYPKKITLSHVDITLVAQEPRISPYTLQIQKTLANLLSLELDQVNIKATTEEKLGFTGSLLGIKAIALVSATREEK